MTWHQVHDVASQIILESESHPNGNQTIEGQSRNNSFTLANTLLILIGNIFVMVGDMFTIQRIAPKVIDPNVGHGGGSFVFGSEWGRKTPYTQVHRRKA